MTFDEWFIKYKKERLKGKLPEFIDFAYQVCGDTWKSSYNQGHSDGYADGCRKTHLDNHPAPRRQDYGFAGEGPDNGAGQGDIIG